MKRISKVSLISLLLLTFICTPVLADINASQFDPIDKEIFESKASSSKSYTEGVLIAQATKPRQGFWQRMAFWKRNPQVKQKGRHQGFLQRFNGNRKQKATKAKRVKRQAFWQRTNVKRFIPKFKARRNKKQNG